MNLYLRLLLALMHGSRGQRMPHDGVATNTFRVWPHDLDAFGHMNNGRYLQIMDVARAEWMTTTGVFRAMREQKWGAVLGGNITRYRRSLKLFQQYTVHTQLICWDQQWFFFEHSFMDSKGRCAAVGLSRAALRDRHGWVATDRVVAEVSPQAITEPMPPHVERWVNLENEIYVTAANNKNKPMTVASEV
ncbi:MAG: thioesterase family protein [Pseudomonadota bacterium]